MYRIYGTKTIVVVVIVVVRIEHIITVHVRVSIAQPEVRIVRIAVNIARSHPKEHTKKKVHIPTTVP